MHKGSSKIDMEMAPGRGVPAQGLRKEMAAGYARGFEDAPLAATRDYAHDQRLRSPARALVIADPVLGGVVTFALNHGQYSIRVAPTVEEAAAALTTWRPHLVILDLDTAGRAILERLRSPQEGCRLPVIAVTRRGALTVKLAAFERGADDVLTIPFSSEELIARTLAVMRRSYSEAVEFTPALRLGDLEIDILNRHVRLGGTDLHLTPLEQSLLYLLAANAGRVVTRDEILDYLWGADYMAESNVVDRHIRNLRAKLESHHRRPKYIATVLGRGYRFTPTTDAGARSFSSAAPRTRQRFDDEPAERRVGAR